MAPVVKAVKKVVKWVAGTVKNVVDFVVDEIIEPVVSFVGDTVEALLDDPIATVAKVVAIATGNAWAIPLIDGASVAANGGDLGDVLKTVAVSYVSQAIGGEVAQHTAPFVDDVIGEALSEGTKQVAVQAITQGTVAATQAIIYGEDPLEAFARGGLTAAVSAGLGKIGEKLGWEMEVTDPDTGQTTTRPIPNVVKNIVGSALAAELTGQDITPELMANAVTRGLITTDLVKKYVATNPNIGDRELSYVTAALQRTAAVALAGGSGEQAAAQIQAVISAYGMEELHDTIRDSGVGDFIGDTLDKISGDYQEVTRLADEIDVVGPRLSANYQEYQDKAGKLRDLWDTIQIERNLMAEFQRENLQGDYDSALARYNEAVTEYNRLAIDEGYQARIEELVPLIEADDALLQTLQGDLTAAQGELQRSADRLDGELVPVFEATNEYLVTAMDPGFNAAQYRALNNLPDDVDAYQHFLAEGQHSNVYTNYAQYEAAMTNRRTSVMNEIMLGGFGIAENSPVWNLSDADRRALATILADQGYNTPQALMDLSLDTQAQEEVFNSWVNAIGENPNRTYTTGDALTENNLEILDYLGFDTRGVAPGAEMTAAEAVALDNYLRTYSGDTEAVIGRAEGVTASDILQGNAVITYSEDGGAQWTIAEGASRWDPEHGWVTERVTYDQYGNKQGWGDYDSDGNLVPGSLGIVIYGGVQDMSATQLSEIVVEAARAGDWASIQEGLGWTDRMINSAQNLFNTLEASDSDFTQNFFANTLKAGGGILEAFNGVSALFGVAPSSTALGQFAQKLQDLGSANNTEEYKAELAQLQAEMSKPSELPDDAPWYERAFETVSNIAGAAVDHPTTFLAEYIGVEAMQELVPLAVGGVATLGAKGAAMAVGKTLSTRMAATAGLTAAGATDIAESFGGTAAETYDRAFSVAMESVNPATGQLFTQAEAEEYAMNLAVESGTVAASLTALTLGVGGLALEKAILNKDEVTGYVADGLNELGRRMVEGGKITLKEGVTESIEEGLATGYREGHLAQIDPTINVSGEVAGAAFMGFLVGGPVAGGAYGVSSVGDMYSNFVSAVDPDVRSAIESGDINAANSAMDALGITDTTTRTNILSQVQPNNYVNEAEATSAFNSAAPGYNATQSEIQSFVKEGNQATVETQIDQYVDDRYFDIDEVKAAAEAEGLTLTDAQAEQYVAQGGAGFSDAAASDLRAELDPQYTSFTEAKKFFTDLGFTPTDAQVQNFVGNIAESTQKTAIANYVDPRQITTAEARAALKAQGFDPSASDIAAFTGQGGANFESSADYAAYVDPRQVTEAEARAFFNDLGYEATDAQIAEYVGQGGVNFESTTGTNISGYVDPRQVTEAEARAFFEAQGFEPTDAQVAEYVGQSTSGTFQQTTQNNVTNFADPRATTEAEVRAMFEAQGYTPTDAEVAARVGQGNASFESTTGTQVGTYVDPRQVTEAEARAFFEAQGYTPTDAEVAAYVGQGGANFDANTGTNVASYVDPRQITTDEAKAFFDSLGYTPTDAEIAQFVGQGGANFEANADVAGYVDPRQMTEAEARAALVAQGIPEPTAEQIAELVGQGGENFQTAQEEYAVEYADPFVTTYEEARQFFNDLGFTPTKAEIESYVGATSEAEQQAAIAAFVDPRYTDADEAREFLTALGYNPTDQEVARFTGQVREEQQKTAIEEYVDPRLVSEDEVRAAYETLGLAQPTDDDIQKLVGQYMESELAGRAEEYLPTARYNSIMNILNNFTGEVGISDEMQAALEVVKNDMIDALGDLGLEVAAIDQAVNNLTDAVGAVANGEEDATGLYAYIDTAIQDLKDAGLTNEEVEATIGSVVGNPATTDADGNEVPATGIYATLADMGTTIDNLNDLSTDDVKKIVADAVGDLNNLSTEDVQTIVTDALGNLENISEDDVKTIVENIVSDLNNLGTDDVETIVSDALSGLENLSTDDVQTVVNDIVGAPATDDAAATGIYSVIANLNNLSADDVGNIVDQIVGTPATDDAAATGLYATIGDLNNISEEDVTTIVTDALSGLENLSTDDVQAVVDGIIGAPATTDAEGNEVAASGLYDYIDDGLSSVQKSVLDKVQEYEDAGIARDEALSTAIGDVATALGTTEDAIMAQIGAPATEDTDATGIYAAIDNNANEILNILGAPATDDTEATGLYNYIDNAVNSLGTDLATLAGNVGTPAEYDADGNVTAEATGIYAQLETLKAQGLTNEEAIAQLATDFGVAVTDLTNLFETTTTAITEDIGEVAGDVSDIAGLLGSPAIADNPLTEEDESADPTGLFGTVAQYEAAGKERDEAISDALDDLATQLGTTKDDILEQMGLGLDQLTTAIETSQTALTEKIDKAVEDIGVDLGDMETSILEKMAEYETAGIERDDALAQAIEDVSTELGQTETDILNALTETETNLLTELGTTEADILAALTATEATLSEQITGTETALSEQITGTEAALTEQITGVEESLSADIDAVSNLVGKPAAEVTQADIDFVVDVIAGNQVMSENLLAQYDVTGDQQITMDDQLLLEQLLAGENVYGQIADTSIYAPTGVYGTVQDTQTALEQQMQQNQEQTLDTIQQMESNIVTNIEQEALRAGGRQFLQAALQAPDAMGQQVTVRTPDPLNLRYIYDWSSIFATPQQQALFPSPYAKGGQVEDTTDKLLNIIGGS